MYIDAYADTYIAVFCIGITQHDMQTCACLSLDSSICLVISLLVYQSVRSTKLLPTYLAS